MCGLAPKRHCGTGSAHMNARISRAIVPRIMTRRIAKMPNKASPMVATFEEDGLSFQYPENWQLQREESANGWTVTLQSPDTAFFMVSFDADMPEAEQMAQTA